MGVVLIVTLAFGLITPPYGLALLMASKFVGVRFSAALRRVAADLRDLLRDDRIHDLRAGAILWLPKMLFPESVGCFKGPDGIHYICP